MQSGSGRMNEGFDRVGIKVNGRHYRLPSEPVVVVCVDGSEPVYIERAVEDTFQTFAHDGMVVGDDNSDHRGVVLEVMGRP